LARWLVFAALGTILAGCGTLAGPLRVDSGPVATPTVHTTASEPGPGAGVTFVAAPVERDASATIADAATPAVIDDAEAAIAAAGVAALEAPVEPTSPAVIETQDTWMAQARENGDVIEDQYDPWEPFNERMFEVNRRLDRYFLKPVAKAYNFITPDELQIMISNGFDNISFPPRFVNSLLQGKWGGAGRELGRFLINSTAGIGGLFDPAKDYWGIQKSREDFGQTLGVWGSGPGPYLVLPLMEPLTVRDGVGKFVDGLMDPLSYVLPFFWTRLGMKAGDTLNDRALNYDLFQGFEESVIDMYSAVRHGYLQRRQQLIKE
jgi:phospholipid-binding lipoprotein MlaA